MDVLQSKLGAGGWTCTVNLQPLLFRLTLDSATEFLFGESAQSQLDSFSDEASQDKHTSFADAFDSAQTRLALAARLGTSYWLMHTRDLQQQVNRVHTFVDYFVNLALKDVTTTTSWPHRAITLFFSALYQGRHRTLSSYDPIC